MKGIPKDGRWYWVRGANPPIHSPATKWFLNSIPDEVKDAEFFQIPPPPDDGEYACVWVEVQRNAEGKRTCNGCKLFGECDKAEVLKIMTVYKHDDPRYFAPGPDCPLGSD